MQRIPIMALLAVFLGGAAPALPGGWREPTQRDVGRQTDRPAHRVSADFDGDGRKDVAGFLVNDRTGKVQLFVRRAATGRYEPLDLDDDVAKLRDYALSVEGAGTFKTACAKGYGSDCAPGEAREIHARSASIGVGADEASYSIFYWDGRRFSQTFLSD